MLRSKQRRRRLFGDKFLDLANYAATALVFSQFVGLQPMSWKVAVLGAGMWLALAMMSYRLTGEP